MSHSEVTVEDIINAGCITFEDLSADIQALDELLNEIDGIVTKPDSSPRLGYRGILVTEGPHSVRIIDPGYGRLEIEPSDRNNLDYEKTADLFTQMTGIGWEPTPYYHSSAPVIVL